MKRSIQQDATRGQEKARTVAVADTGPVHSLQRVASCVSKYGGLTAVLQAVYVCSVVIIK